MKKRKRIITKADRRKIANRNRRTGRGNEAKMAEALKMVKQGAYGSFDGEDDLFRAEFKNRKAFVGMGWMEQAIKNAKGKKIPIVGVHVTGKRRYNDLILLQMRLVDWMKMIKIIRKGLKRDAALHEALRFSKPQKNED